MQHLDMMATKVSFDQTEHKADEQKRVSEVLTTVSDLLEDVLPDPEGFRDPEAHNGWATDAVQLKKDLMISPDEYRLHVSKAGVDFDPAWMTGMAKDGRPVNASNSGTRKVALCLFPAILRQEVVPFDDDASITDALVSHRRFLPTPRERRSLDPSSCIAKATVLVM